MLKSIEIAGFKSFGEKARLEFTSPISSIVGPNGSGKSNVAEAFRFALGEQSMKSLRGKRSEDLIFNGSGGGARSNRASVKVVFDNSQRVLDVDFEDCIVERVVHRDGTHEYKINDSRVRRKDIAELLAKANIGSTGHHIISQGEADRILSVSADERRSMIEDALGLRIFHLKRKESISRLEKTEQNLKDVEALQKEIKPHLNFLKKQIEKAEKARSTEEKLVGIYREYFSYESSYVEYEKSDIQAKKAGPESELLIVEGEIGKLKEVLDEGKEESAFHGELLKLSDELSSIQGARNKLTRDLGRVEGEIDVLSRMKRMDEKKEATSDVLVPHSRISSFFTDLKGRLSDISSLDDISSVKDALGQLPDTLSSFLESFKESKKDKEVGASPAVAAGHDIEGEKTLLDEKRVVMMREIESLDARKQSILEKQRSVQEKHDSSREGFFAAERDLFKVLARKNELQSVLGRLHDRSLLLSKREEALKKDLGEAGMIFGRSAVSYSVYEGDFDEDAQSVRIKDIERLRIKLEEMGVGSVREVEAEYKEVSDRDAFLDGEIKDLTHSRESLLSMIEDIERELTERFRNGVATINTQFNEFFRTMFGGGTAELLLVRPKRRRKASDDVFGLDIEIDEEEVKEGIEIDVTLPKKKINSLDMLSGGERALTSIALLFALSQINPPPFIILDETDAALDEANSKRYGDMIERLSKYSQLILITHNRETMSRAGLLYGVTMKGDGISRLLSIAFEEAVLVAK